MPSLNNSHDTEAICEHCIWHHDWEGLLRTGPCSQQSWAGSVQAELAKTGIFPDLSMTVETFTPFWHCAALMMVKDEADIIATNLAWLYHIGIRRFVVLDNNSTDTTPTIISKFQLTRRDVQLLALHDPTVEHLQAEKTTAMGRLARDMWPDLMWLLPIDADEFIIPRHGLQALAYVPDFVDALTIQKVVHFYPPGVIGRHGVAKPALMSTRCHAFAVPPKVVMRSSNDLVVTAGNHKAVRTSGHRVLYSNGLQYGLFYREFQTRSFKQFLSKVRNGGAAILAARALGCDVGGEHWMNWYETLQRGGELALKAVYKDVAYRELGPAYIHDPFDAVSGIACP